MKIQTRLLLMLLLLQGACTSPPQEASTTARLALGLGIDTQHMNSDVRPQDDPYRFV
ncbi:MAG: hypothetical protein JRE57_06870, partial [Deltaproteobacteria bacterium]|nr:hypothetical protein [Deltaproteobacteria bacterium]